MTRTDRLLAIVLELQRAGKRRAADLAATFETSARTIYRDMEALSEAGVPVVAVPGWGYALMEGYFLPPLSFRTGEATMLLLGSDVMAQQFDAQYRVAAESAAAKIESVLPETLWDEVRSLQESIRFFAPGDPAEQERLQTLRRAILDRRTARFRYTARWVREARSFFTVAEEETPDGLLVTLNVRDERDVLQWLLGWGSHVCVLEPESLRRVRFNPRHSATSSRCPRRMACR